MRIFSGATGALLYAFFGDSIGEQFGASVSGIGDVNNDGFADVIVGASNDDNNGPGSGSVTVISGINGFAMYIFSGDSANDRFGWSVSGAGDVNNDGIPDFIVGAPFDDNNGTNSGSARVFSGLNGSTLYTFNGDSAGDLFGWSVSGAGDVNNDGFDEFIVGAPFDANNGTNSGSARVFSGFNGSILYSFDGDSADDFFGVSVSGSGDVNSDGFADFIVGAHGDDNNGTNSGSARVFSGLNGSTLYIFNGDSPGDSLGRSVSGAGDVNSDGYADLIVGANTSDNNGAESGSARIFSGIDGSLLYIFNGDSAGDNFGFAVSGAGDLNNDGVADFIVGAYFADNNGANSGSARVFVSAAPACPAHCSGNANADTAVNFDDITTVLANWLSVGAGTSTQIVLAPTYPFNGDSANDAFGGSVSCVGDVNNDGYDDFIVGAHADDNNGAESGSARVISGATGAIIYTLNGAASGDFFGSSVSDAGDVNNDGVPDIIVGARLADPNGGNSGSASVFSGNTGALLYTFNGVAVNDQLGGSVSGAGDVNNDGFDDVIVGARLNDQFGPDTGCASVYSGFNGSILYTFYGEFSGDLFGISVSGAGDVNNDGFADLIVGGNGNDNTGLNAGSARVLSGFNGTVLYSFYGDSASDQLGYSVSGAGDVNNDGFADLIVGAPTDDNNGTNSGSARVYSGFNGAVLYTWSGVSAGDHFGWSVSSAGDVNNDGFDDLIVGARYEGANGFESGSARVFSGIDGAILFTWNGDSANDWFGDAVGRAGDLNGDAIPDLIVGAPQDSNNGFGSGSVRIFLSATAACPVAASGDANANGIVNFDDITAVLANWLNTCP